MWQCVCEGVVWKRGVWTSCGWRRCVKRWGEGGRELDRSAYQKSKKCTQRCVEKTHETTTCLYFLCFHWEWQFSLPSPTGPRAAPGPPAIAMHCAARAQQPEPGFHPGTAADLVRAEDLQWAWRFHQDFTNFIGKTRVFHRDYCGDITGRLMERIGINGNPMVISCLSVRIQWEYWWTLICAYWCWLKSLILKPSPCKVHLPFDNFHGISWSCYIAMFKYQRVIGFGVGWYMRCLKRNQYESVKVDVDWSTGSNSYGSDNCCGYTTHLTYGVSPVLNGMLTVKSEIHIQAQARGLVAGCGITIQEKRK